MASISRPRANGSYRVEYYVDKKKDAFMLPTKNRTAAKKIADMVQRLLDWRKHKEPDPVLFEWLKNLPENMRERLESKGLIETQHRVTLQDAVNAYVDSKKAGRDKLTYENRLTENRWFLTYFKPEMLLEQIDRHAAVKFMNWLQSNKKLKSHAYINKIMKWATSVFKYAISCGDFSPPNPFEGVRLPEKVLRDKQYITIEYTEQLMGVLPTIQWRTVVAMLRYGGMRPEEVILAEWDGVDWKAGTFTFRSPKTEYIQGKERRTIPLFPRLRQALEKMRMAAVQENGNGLPRYIISTNKSHNGWDSKRDAVENGRRMTFAQLSKYIKKANLANPGAVPTNMRGSCSTDLKRKYPEYAVDSWLGHAKEVANKHYDVVTQDLYEQAAKNDDYPPTDNGCDNCCDNVAINPTVKHQGTTRNNSPILLQTHKYRILFQEMKTPCETLQGENLPPRGFEPL